MTASEREPRADQSGRVALSLLASVGAVETGIITSEKLGLSSFGVVDKLCTSTGGGCSDVLSGPWASIAGVPLSLFGLLAYSTVAVLAAAPLLTAPSVEDDENSETLASALVFGSGALAAFSSCLLLLLALVIKQSCVLCFGSASISFAIFAVAWTTPLLREKTDSAVYASSGALISLAAALTLFFYVAAEQPTPQVYGSNIDKLQQELRELQTPPKIKSQSSARALDIAKRLSERGGQFYGAFWCSHCAGQKETLGQEAMKIVPYVECAADGVNSRRDECVEANVKGYPTWVLDGKLYPGERNLGELEAMLEGKAEAGELP